MPKLPNRAQRHRLAAGLLAATMLQGCVAPAATTAVRPVTIAAPGVPPPVRPAAPAVPPVQLDWEAADYVPDPTITAYLKTHKGVPGLQSVHYIVAKSDPADDNSVYGAERLISYQPGLGRTVTGPTRFSMKTGGGTLARGNYTYLGSPDDFVAIGHKWYANGRVTETCRAENLTTDAPADPRRLRPGSSFTVSYDWRCSSTASPVRKSVTRTLVGARPLPGMPGAVQEFRVQEDGKTSTNFYVPSLGWEFTAGTAENTGLVMSFGYTLNGRAAGPSFDANAQPYIAMIGEIEQMEAEQAALRAEQARMEAQAAAEEARMQAQQEEAETVEAIGALLGGIIGVAGAMRRR